jgi:hypothetical protein
MSKAVKAAHTFRQFVRQPGVGGRKAGDLGFEAVGIAVDGQRAPIRPAHLEQLVVVDHRAILHGAEFLPHAVEGLAGAGAKEVVDAAVEDVALAIPRRTQPAGEVVQLKDVALVAVHLGVTARRQSSNAGANDRDRFRHIHTLQMSGTKRASGKWLRAGCSEWFFLPVNAGSEADRSSDGDRASALRSPAKATNFCTAGSSDRCTGGCGGFSAHSPMQRYLCASVPDWRHSFNCRLS